jgi:hypothetical protein
MSQGSTSIQAMSLCGFRPRKRFPKESGARFAMNLCGFHLIIVLPKWFKFNASFYVTQILRRRFDSCRTQVGKTNRKLWVHADHARLRTATVTLQFMQANAMRRAPHAPYSPDRTPSSFHFFDYIKQFLSEYEIADRDSFFKWSGTCSGVLKREHWKAFFGVEWSDCTNIQYRAGNSDKTR